MDGVKAAEKLSKMKRMDLIPDIPIFACTAFDDEQDKEICFRSQIVKLVIKGLKKIILL